MSDPTSQALAAYRRLNPDQPGGCHVDLSGYRRRTARG
jgi:hypothetical protein